MLRCRTPRSFSRRFCELEGGPASAAVGESLLLPGATVAAAAARNPAEGTKVGAVVDGTIGLST